MVVVPLKNGVFKFKNLFSKRKGVINFCLFLFLLSKNKKKGEKNNTFQVTKRGRKKKALFLVLLLVLVLVCVPWVVKIFYFKRRVEVFSMRRRLREEYYELFSYAEKGKKLIILLAEPSPHRKTTI